MATTYDFQYLWKCYRDDIKWQNFGGFKNWWKIPFLKRGLYKFQHFNEGYMPYNSACNIRYPAATAFCINYVISLMETIVDHELPGVEIPDGQQPPEDEDCFSVHVLCEFLKVEDLQNYLKEEYDLFLKAIKDADVNITFNEQKTIICFYVDEP